MRFPILIYVIPSFVKGIKLLIMFCYLKNTVNKFFFSENSIRKRTAI